MDSIRRNFHVPRDDINSDWLCVKVVFCEGPDGVEILSCALSSLLSYRILLTKDIRQGGSDCLFFVQLLNVLIKDIKFQTQLRTSSKLCHDRGMFVGYLHSTIIVVISNNK